MEKQLLSHHFLFSIVKLLQSETSPQAVAIIFIASKPSNAQGQTTPDFTWR